MSRADSEMTENSSEILENSSEILENSSEMPGEDPERKYMSLQELTEKTIGILNDIMDAGIELRAGTSLADELGLNSFDMVHVMMACEEELNITIDGEDFLYLRTVEDIASYLQDIIGQKA